MSQTRPSIVCERVRAQISLRLDAELSQLEDRMLEAHLARCAACSFYAADVETFTAQIRSAPLERLERPIVVLRQRQLSTTRFQIGVAAVLAFAALGLGTQLSASETQDSSLARFEGQPNFSPPFSVLEREQALVEVVRPGRPLPPRGSVL